MGSVASGVAGDPFSDLCRALRAGGQAAAVAAAKTFSPADRVAVLEVLLSYLLAPLTGLAIDLRDDMIRPARQAWAFKDVKDESSFVRGSSSNMTRWAGAEPR